MNAMYTKGEFSVVPNPEWTEETADTECRWWVVDANGDGLDDSDDLEEAKQMANDYHFAAVEEEEEEREAEEEEERESRLSDLRDEITDLLTDCEDETILAKVKALLS